MRSMKKYVIGLIIITLVTLGLAGYVVSLGLGSRQDVKTEKSEQEVGDKLNAYIIKENKLPDSLSQAGAKDVPSSITYKKLSSEEYKLCVTYKAAKGYGGSDITSVVTGAVISNMYGMGSSPDYSGSSYTPSSYYPSYTHKKGETCQTVKPYLQPDYSSTSPSTIIDDSAYCSPTGQYYEFYKDYCVEGKLEFN